MTLTRFPGLLQLCDELARLGAEEAQRAAARDRPGKVKTSEGRDTTKVSVPWLGDYWLTGPQRAVVRALVDAAATTPTPDVRQDVLMRLAGARGGRLSDLFAGSQVWGELIVPGKGAGTFRLAPPPQDEVRVEPPDVEDW